MAVAGSTMVVSTLAVAGSAMVVSTLAVAGRSMAVSTLAVVAVDALCNPLLLRLKKTRAASL